MPKLVLEDDFPLASVPESATDSQKLASASPSDFSHFGSEGGWGCDSEGLTQGAAVHSHASLMKLELNRLVTRAAPPVPREPAPHILPHRTPKKIPYKLLAPPPPTSIGRMLNSTFGRMLTFLLTVLNFTGAAVGFCIWQSPEYHLKQLANPLLALTVSLACALYTLVPMLARKAGMAPSDYGVDWKPYFVFYRISFIMAIPAFVLLSLGYGAKFGFGKAGGPAGEVHVQDLVPGTLDYFEAADGFVALNLTKGVTQTLSPTEHGDAVSLRLSRFRDAELRINKEPYSDIPEPTVPPGAFKLFRIAPIFEGWNVCLTRYQVSTDCLKQNSVVGWAVSQTSSLCTGLGVVPCRPPKPVLEPVYQCSTAALRGVEETGSVAGVCGRVVEPIFEGALDEFSAMLISDGWPAFTLPNSSHVWVDVNIDDCIAHPADCLQKWDTLGLVGILFAALTMLCILVPAVLDCYVDKRLREAREYFEETQRRNRKNAKTII